VHSYTTNPARCLPTSSACPTIAGLASRPEELDTAEDDDASTFQVAATTKAKLRPQTSVACAAQGSTSLGGTSLVSTSLISTGKISISKFSTNKLFRKVKKPEETKKPLEIKQAPSIEITALDVSANHLKATKSSI